MSMSSDHGLIARFLEMMSAEAGAARNSLMAYESDLRAASTQLQGGLSTADDAAINRLADHWSDLAASSVARKSSALRRFFGFLVDVFDAAGDLVLLRFVGIFFDC